MVFGLFGGSHLIQAQSPPDAVWQPCASDTSFLLTYCSRPYDYTMGYEFSPRANGQITQLCGYFNGTKRVKLWDSSYSVLASSWITNDVTSNGIGILSSNWSCSDITPVDVTSSSTYYVTVDGGGSGLCYNTVQSSDLLPQRCADNKINISNSVLQPTSGTFNSSHNSSTKYMYGVVDVVFEIDEIPVISVTPTSRNFGSVGIGSTDDLTFTVQNTGTGTLTGSVTGLADPFTCVSNCSYSLTAGQSRNTTIRFTPTVTGVFTDVAIFSIAGGTSLNRDVVGIGTIPSPVISVAPTSRDFGPVEIGSTDDLIFTVQNTGTGTLTGTASVTTPFSCVGGCSYSLTAGQSQNTTIRFTPTAEGAASETVSFTGASGTSTTVDGSGVETPAISVTPTSRDFGPVEIGSTDDLTFTVQNTGTGTLTGSMTGLAAPFTCISNCSYSLTAGQSQNTIVRFTPTSVATSSDVAIFSIAGGTSLNRNIVGSGVSTGGGGACQNHNVEGWAFANVPQAAGNSFEGLNWISFSCENQSASVDYGVDIETNGNLTGYAYFDMNDLNTTADEMGWIDFNPTSGFPTAPNFSARVDLDGTTCGRVGRICGWARAVNTDTSWDGWLKLSGSNYETTLDSSTTPSVIDGWAWGSDILGWVKIDAETSFSVNPPPSVTELRVEGNIGYCTSIQRRGYGTITWLYDGDSNQDEYELQIFTNASFSGATSIIRSQSIATGSRGSTGLAVLPTFSFSDLEIGYNDRYYLRIMVKDSSDNWSDWSNTLIIDTARHAYPYPQFTWDPSSPAVDETVIIDNTSICYNNSNNPVNCSSYSWTKPASANYMDATSSSSFEPHIQFTETGDNTLELLARDSRNYTCTRSSVVGIKLPFPDWIEVNPE